MALRDKLIEKYGFVPEGAKKPIKFEEKTNWAPIEEAYKNHLTMEGEVISVQGDKLLVNVKNKIGGITIEDVFGLIPYEEIQYYKPIDLEHIPTLIGRTVLFKINHIDKENGMFVASRREVQEEFADVLFENIKEGDVIPAVVASYAHPDPSGIGGGVYVDVGGAIGFIPITELSWKVLTRPSDAVKIGDTIEVKVIKIDKENQRLICSLKQLLPDPFKKYIKIFSKGSEAAAKVVRNVPKKGIVVELVPGIQAFCLMPKQIPSIGDKIMVKILNINEQERKILCMMIRKIG